MLRPTPKDFRSFHLITLRMLVSIFLQPDFAKCIIKAVMRIDDIKIFCKSINFDNVYSILIFSMLSFLDLRHKQ